MPVLLADAGTLERVFQVLKADPVIGFLALVVTALAVVSTALFASYRGQLEEARAELRAERATKEAELQKRVELAMTVVALQTKTGLVLDEAMATLTSVDDMLPALQGQLERLGVRRRPGSTGSTPVVVPPKTGTP
jgi:hypothetical protein